MFCPNCEAEYKAGVTYCPDDGAELVERLMPEAGASDDSEARFVPLHTLSSPAEAEMVNDILQQNGIRRRLAIAPPSECRSVAGCRSPFPPPPVHEILPQNDILRTGVGGSRMHHPATAVP